MNTGAAAAAGTADRLNATQWRVIALCFATAMVDGFDTLILSFVAPLVGKEFGLGPVEIGKLFSANFAGAVIGGLLVGPLADRYGRRRMLTASLIVAVIFSAAVGVIAGLFPGFKAARLNPIEALRYE